MILSVLPLERVNQVTIIGFVASLLLSPNLWASNSEIPRVGLIPISFPIWLDIVLFVSLLVALIASYFKKSNVFIGVVISITIIFVLTDQMRLQPWVYFYLIILATFFIGNLWNVDSRYVEAFLRLFISSIYVFSGLQKLNSKFTSDLFPWILNETDHLIPAFVIENSSAFAIVVACVEIAIGICLLIRRIQKPAVIALIVFIAFLLFLLGPIGADTNNVVWPWNIAMATIAFLLFYNERPLDVKLVFKNFGSSVASIAVVIFLLLPALNFVGLWDSYLSWSLYSGNVDTAVIRNTETIEITNWSFEQYNVPPYPETRVYKQIFKETCDEGSELHINEKSTLLNQQKNTRHVC